MLDTVEGLRRLSHILLWVTIVLPAIAAAAAGARYYVERREKQLSSQITAASINAAKADAAQAQAEVDRLKPRRLSAEAKALIRTADLAGIRVDVHAHAFDGESLDLANDILEALVAAGAESAGQVAVGSMNDFPGYVAISRVDGASVEQLKAVGDALFKAGLTVKVEHPRPQSFTRATPGSVMVFVGRRGS